MLSVDTLMKLMLITHRGALKNIKKDVTLGEMEKIIKSERKQDVYYFNLDGWGEKAPHCRKTSDCVTHKKSDISRLAPQVVKIMQQLKFLLFKNSINNINYSLEFKQNTTA